MPENRNPRPPASWVLNEKTRTTVLAVSEERTDLLIERLHGPGACVLSVIADGRMLTNGQDVDVSDDFPAYLGYFDIFGEMGENVAIGSSVVMDDENLVNYPDESYMGLIYQIDVLARRMAGISSEQETYPVLIEMLDTIQNHDTAEDNSPIPFEGELAEPLVKMLRAAICPVLMYMNEDIDWDENWNERLIINPNNTWVMPGTFHSDRGRWEIRENQLIITTEDPDAGFDPDAL